MPLRILGEHPLARDPHGNLKCRIGTFFVKGNALVTLPGVHATQRVAYIDDLNRQRATNGLPPLTGDEQCAEWSDSVDLIMEDNAILIRPDPDAMALAFEADEKLQELASKRNIRFLHVMNKQVQQAITERGELWRIAPLPQSQQEIKDMILASKIAIANRPIYYYNKISGTRHLTAYEFARLGDMDAQALARQLQEIRDFSGKTNRRGNPEVDFFMADESFGHWVFDDSDFLAASPEEVLRRYGELKTKFHAAVRSSMREDNPDDPEWRRLAFSALISQKNEPVAEEILRGLSPEFFLQVRWLPGGRIESGELIFDSIFNEQERRPADPELQDLCDFKARRFIVNFMREFGDIRCVNVGRVVDSLSNRARRKPGSAARRGVYIAEVRLRGAETPLVRIIRMQKWGIAEHLRDGKDLLQAILQTEEYTDYILDRRLGCQQLGMKIPPRITTRKITEKYEGPRAEYAGRMIWSTYFEREYIDGAATDKIAPARFRDPEYALRFARLLGETAAPSMIVGRSDVDGKVLFDDGDEVVIEDAGGYPADIIVADHTGAFANFVTELAAVAPDYALPVKKRAAFVADPAAFANAYLGAFLDRFLFIQSEYRKRKAAFDSLFRHREPDAGGNFAFRWLKVLERLDRTDASALTDAIRRQILS